VIRDSDKKRLLQKRENKNILTGLFRTRVQKFDKTDSRNDGMKNFFPMTPSPGGIIKKNRPTLSKVHPLKARPTSNKPLFYKGKTLLIYKFRTLDHVIEKYFLCQEK